MAAGVDARVWYMPAHACSIYKWYTVIRTCKKKKSTFIAHLVIQSKRFISAACLFSPGAYGLVVLSALYDVVASRSEFCSESQADLPLRGGVRLGWLSRCLHLLLLAVVVEFWIDSLHEYVWQLYNSVQHSLCIHYPIMQNKICRNFARN